MLLFTIYLIGLADKFLITFSLLATVSGIYLSLTLFGICIGEIKFEDYKRILKYTTTSFVITLLITILTPSSKTIQYMAAAKIGELVVQSEQFKGVSTEVGVLAGKSAKALEKMLDEYSNSKE